MSDSLERVKVIIVDLLGVDPEQVTVEARFREDLEADSLDLVELIMALEEEFGGEISDEQAQKITTVGDAIVFLDGRSYCSVVDEPDDACHGQQHHSGSRQIVAQSRVDGLIIQSLDNRLGRRKSATDQNHAGPGRQ